MVVMVDHGSHRTVYANLCRVSVVDGQDITTGTGHWCGAQTLGNGHQGPLRSVGCRGQRPLESRILDCPMKYALVGNPNCGKTSLFNTLTGSRAKVANLPGVTVSPP